jgi:Tfp pilus assembly protein PilO
VQVKTKNLMVGALVVLLVGGLWYKVVYSPMESKASKAKSAARVADASSAKLRQSLDEFSGAKKKANDATKAAMLAAVPGDGAEASFLRGIDELRITSGAAWQSITPSVPVFSGNLTTITVAISVQGTEEQLLRYVSGLSASKRLFVVDALTINAGGGGPAAPGTPAKGSAPGGVFSGGPLQMQITGRIFSQPGAAAVPGGATAAITRAPAAPGA